MSTASTALALGRDITVTFDLPHRAYYSGVRAQLEAEVLIPPGTVWPEGFATVCWMTGDLRFSLCRTRPEGVMAPVEAATRGDYWYLSTEVCGPNRAKYEERRRKKQRLDRLAWDLRPLSPAGRLEIATFEKRVLAAQGDQAFQAFKACILPKKARRGRPPKDRSAA